MDLYSQDTRSPKRIRLSHITNQLHIRTPQSTFLNSHPQIKRTRDGYGRLNPSPALTPDAKARRRKAIEAAMAQAETSENENSFQSESFGTPSRSASSKSFPAGLERSQEMEGKSISMDLSLTKFIREEDTSEVCFCMHD
jgi:hypothetical protein